MNDSSMNKMIIVREKLPDILNNDINKLTINEMK